MKKGFTLIELMIVITILGFIFAIAIPKMSHSKEVTKFTSLKYDAKNAVQVAQKTFLNSLSYVTFPANCGIITSPGNIAICIGNEKDFTINISDTEGICDNPVTYNSQTDAGIIITTCK